MSPTTKSLPTYLKKYITEQHYDRYTAQEHAVWRYIMRQNRAFFREHAAAVYLEGLAKTGIQTERIPRITEMDDCLAKFGWGAVAVEGFIPPGAFLDFQSRGVLPIACDMRTISHLAYTPAPDIVHEAAGHAPILADPDYAKYLHKYAAMARRAIFSKDDIRLYEAIRTLSDFKENPDKTAGDIQLAEEKLIQVSKSVSHISESMKVARMNWWTVEYGLVGDVSNPQIYGAGLLSSVGESQTCLSPKVRKLPLSLVCVETAYNITEPQPQLFVAKSMGQLIEVLEEFEATLAYSRGGVYAVKEAILAETATTTTLDSGLQITGVLSHSQYDAEDVSFLKWTGPVHLAFKDSELEGHGSQRHVQGFSMPLGRWKGAPSKPLSLLTDGELKTLGLVAGKDVELKFENGIHLKGRPLSFTRAEGKLLLITFSTATITRGGEVLYDPSWGEMDLAVGDSVLAVSAGLRELLSDSEFDVGNPTTHPGRTSPFSQNEIALFACYQKVREGREKKVNLDSTAQDVLQHHPDEWLLLLELFEEGKALLSAEMKSQIEARLDLLSKNGKENLRELISKGLLLVQ